MKNSNNFVQLPDAISNVVCEPEFTRRNDLVAALAGEDLERATDSAGIGSTAGLLSVG